MISSLQNNAVSFKGSVNESIEKKETKKIDVSGKIDDFNKETREITDSLAETTETLTSSIGTIGTSAAGIWAICGKPVKKLVNFFSKEKLNEAGEVITKKLLGKDGKPLINEETGKEIVQVVRTADWKKIGIAGAVVALGLTALAIFKAVTNKNAKTEAPQGDTVEISQRPAETKAQEVEETQETEETEE